MTFGFDNTFLMFYSNWLVKWQLRIILILMQILTSKSEEFTCGRIFQFTTKIFDLCGKFRLYTSILLSLQKKN